MKKPRKPKAKRSAPSPSTPPSGSKSGRAIRATAAGKPELGAAALAFLRRDEAPKQRLGCSRGQSLPTGKRSTSGAQALGPAARAFLRSQAPLRAMATARNGQARGAPPSDAIDQRQLVTLLLLPFFLLAFALGMSQSWRHPVRTADPARAPQTVAVAPISPVVVGITPPALRLPTAPPVVEAPEPRLATPAMMVPGTPPAIELPPVELAEPNLALPGTPPLVDAPRIALAAPALRLPDAPPVVAIETAPSAAPVAPAEQLAAIAPPAAPVLPAPVAQPSICLAQPGFGRHTYEVRAVGPGEDFGERLAMAARAQIDQLVVYNDQYRRIAYPMGDVPPFFGVCTDVIIRAYRALGVDLQELVAQARVGSGDTSIQHRRTETLRRFLASRGQSLPVTTFPEDYRPGDIVTYYRPQNNHSRAHIAIVSDRLAPSGRPMVVHNRGWGPQLEDALFVDQITGHYRFQPAPATPVLAPQIAAHAERQASPDLIAPGQSPARAERAQPPARAERTQPPARAERATVVSVRKTAIQSVPRPVQKAAYSSAPSAGAQAASKALTAQ